LEPLKSGLNAGRHRFDSEGFCQTGHAFEKNMTVREQTEQQAIDQIFLTDDDMTDLLSQRRDPLTQLLDLLSNFLS
jgi:hypothetical protein